MQINPKANAAVENQDYETMKTLIKSAFVTCVIALSIDVSFAANPGQTLELSPDVMELLRAEMREITVGVKHIPSSLAAADWQSIKTTATKIRESYIMESRLTPDQAEELQQALPERFKRTDAEFHQRAEKLAAAAEAHDAEAVVFHYSRLLEGCTQCHAEFATHRFPGFSSQTPPEHHH